MFPTCRGSASLVAVVFASVVLLASLWLAFGLEGGSSRDSNVGDGGNGGTALEREAAALSQRIAKGTDGRAVPEGFTFHRPHDTGPIDPPIDPDTAPHPGVSGFSGRQEGSSIVLTWSGIRGAKAGGYRVERLGPGGELLGSARLGAESLTWRDPGLDALEGARRYRVSALDEAGELSPGPQEVARVEFRFGFRLEYMGTAADLSARFAVVLEGAGGSAREEFTAKVGEMIGGPVEATADTPGFDWTTGRVYRGLRGRRLVESHETDVPVFGPKGELLRDEASGQMKLQTRAVPVSRVIEEAGVSSAGAPDEVHWYQRTED